MKNPNTYRKGSYWEAMETDVWNSDPYFAEILEAFPNLESALVSLEMEEANLRYWMGWYHTLGYIAQFLISSIPKHIKMRWGFQPTSHPSLQEVNKEEEEIMEEIKSMVAEETAEKGGTVQLGESIIKENMATWRDLYIKSQYPSIRHDGSSSSGSKNRRDRCHLKLHEPDLASQHSVARCCICCFSFGRRQNLPTLNHAG